MYHTFNLHRRDGLGGWVLPYKDDGANKGQKAVVVSLMVLRSTVEAFVIPFMVLSRKNMTGNVLCRNLYLSRAR